MKKLTIAGKINFVSGIIVLVIGIFLLIQEFKVGFTFTLKDFRQSFPLILMGISILLSVPFYKKENK